MGENGPVGTGETPGADRPSAQERIRGRYPDLTARRRRSDFGLIVLGAILVIVGGFYALTNLAGINLDWDAIWPLGVLVLGVVIIARAVISPSSPEPRT